MTGYESKRAAAQDKLEQRTGEKQMKAYCENCGLLQPASFRPCNDAVTGAFYEDLCCDTCHFIVATVEEREALAQPAQEPASVTYKEVADTMNALRKGTVEQRQISAEMENKRLYTAPQQPAQEPVAWMNKHGDCKSAVFREAEAGAKEEYNIPLYTNQTLEKNT